MEEMIYTAMEIVNKQKTVGSCETRLENWARIVATSALVNDNQRLRNDLGNREEEIGWRKKDLKWDHQKEDKG